MVFKRIYQDTDEASVLEFMGNYYRSHKLSSPFLPCNHTWVSILTKKSFYHRQVLYFNDAKLIGLITMDGFPGDLFFLFLDEYNCLMEDALAYSEKNLTYLDNGKNVLSFRFNEKNEYLQDLLIKNGYSLLWEDYDTYLLKEDSFFSVLPEGYQLKTVSKEKTDIGKLVEMIYNAFSNPKEEFSRETEIDTFLYGFEYKDYDINTSFYIEASNGDYAAYAHIWVKEDACVLEPLCTNAKYRCLGLGKVLLNVGFELAKKHNCAFFRGGPMEYYVKQGFRFMKGYHYGKCVK